MTSDRVDQLDAPAEVFYRRLLSKVDDHGLYDARPSILRASLYPLRVDRVREADCTRWLAACQKAGLIALYEAEGKPLLMVLNTQWEKRSKPKFPLPPENICKQLQTTVPLVVDVVVVEDVVKPSASSDESLSAEKPPNGNGHSKAVIGIPLNDGSEFPITEAMLGEFDALYPAVDCRQTLNEIRAWNLTNPTNRKTKTGILRHVNGWLAKEQNKAR